jgi:hypothetical protein
MRASNSNAVHTCANAGALRPSYPCAADPDAVHAGPNARPVRSGDTCS